MTKPSLPSPDLLTFCRLYDNNIGDQGAIAIAKALEVNASLKILVLENNNIGDDGAKALASALEVNASLKTLDLRVNKIGDAGATAIANAIAVNASLKLESLWVDYTIKHNPQLVDACRAKGVKLV